MTTISMKKITIITQNPVQDIKFNIKNKVKTSKKQEVNKLTNLKKKTKIKMMH
jgi:hypothetical protein